MPFGRDAHKSVVAGLILAGIQPVWVDPRWDADRHLAHPPSADDFEAAFAAHPDAKGALVTSPTPYGTCADLRALADTCHRRRRPLIVDEAWGAGLDGWRRQMVQHGRDLLDGALRLANRVRGAVEAIDGLHVHDRADFCGPDLADDFDPLPVVIDVSGLRATGYRVADWLRTHRSVDVHLSDHRRINTQLTHADDEETTGALLAALTAVSAAASELRPAPAVDVPPPATLRLPQSCLPRDAFFGPVEDVPAQDAVGRVAAEMITPYPPGIPAVLPGELLTEPVLRYLRSGIEAGMNLPDAVDTQLDTVRVVASGKG